MKSVILTLLCLLTVASVCYSQGNTGCIASELTQMVECVQLRGTATLEIFCYDDCYQQLALAYNGCGFTGEDNPVETMCAGTITTVITSEPTSTSVDMASTTTVGNGGNGAVNNVTTVASVIALTLFSLLAFMLN